MIRIALVICVACLVLAAFTETTLANTVMLLIVAAIAAAIATAVAAQRAIR